MPAPLLLVLSGPTAVGKTAAAVALGKHFNTTVVSADSRQLYKEIPVGTAAPSTEEQQGVPHAFIGSHSITDEVDAGRYEREALTLLEKLFAEKNIVVLCGGSGLYIDAVCNGFDSLPRADAALRKELMDLFENEGISALQERLRLLDPEYYNTVDLKNPHRLVRALEVCLLTGRPYSSMRSGEKKERPFRVLKIALEMDREQLYDRINRRVLEMFAHGLEEEARRMLPLRSLNALQTVGYKELFDYFDGKMDFDAAVALIQQHTRNFARRQLTWLRRDAAYHWLPYDAVPEIIALAEKTLQA